MSIELNDASFTYTLANGEAIKALAPTMLTVEPGESVAVVGSNGSGKSTLAKLMNGLLAPTTGSVTVDGLSTANAGEMLLARRTVGMVFQNPDNQLIATIVEDDVAFGPENLGLPQAEIRARVDESLKVVGMYEYRRHDPHYLSAGQRQKIAIAGILAMRPRYMIMDEPTSMLDPAGRRDVLATLADLRRDRSVAVVHITHVIEEAAHADRVIVLKRGRILAAGKPGAILSDEILMVEAGLYITRASQLAHRLAAKGVPVASGLITAEEVAEALCSLS
ncbi:MAG: energy-coupling factor transporter ATPase [Actinomycetota bacterium]|nr:energy-coupling factor transporter ATPase [Actinomycetota bacterium]